MWLPFSLREFFNECVKGILGFLLDFAGMTLTSKTRTASRPGEKEVPQPGKKIKLVSTFTFVS